jgi:uncharacterized protein (TIGR02145 family)
MYKNPRSLAGLLLLAGLFFFSLNSCEKDKINPPALSTAPATEITYSTVVTGGNIADDGGAGVTARGVCWGTNLNPGITGSHTVDGAGSGPFTSTLDGLTPGMEYHIRAYATNSIGTSYGSDITFTTIAATAATVTTKAVTAPTHNAATGGGTITDDGGDPVIASGVCWSTTTGPSVTGPHTTDGASTGSFDSNITGLLPATTYYVRAYATNGKGTAYGEERSFTTLLGDNDGNSYGIVTIGDQVWMAKNLATTSLNDGTPIANLSVPEDWEAATAPAYVWYSNNELLYKLNYGALYNWYAVASDKLCPEGWHVPTETEWNTLINFLGGVNVAGGSLKQAGTALWFSPNEGATNESGFTALPGGGRKQTGEFEDRGTVAVWWTSTPSGTSGDNGFGVGLVNDKTSANIGNSLTGAGRSIRCLRNQ